MPKQKPSKKPKDDDKVFDVAKPGKTPADSTAKPVIVGHKAILQDPMVKPEQADELVPDKEESPAQVSATAPTIQPLDEPEEQKPAADEVPAPKKNSIAVTDVSETSQAEVKTKAEPPAETNESQVQDSIADEQDADNSPPSEQADAEPSAAAEEDENAAPETSESEQTAEQDAAGSDSAAMTAVASQAGNKKEADKLAQQEAEKQAAVEKLIAEKKYYVPIGEKKHRRTLLATLMLLFLAIILGLLLINTLVELDIIHTNIEPPVRIFSR